jgi:hypothetical protein
LRQAQRALFGYGPIWRCGEHRLEGPVMRSRPDPIQMMINAWIEANWPETTDDLVCRHCRRKSDNLIPLGYGTRPRIWVHIECSDPYRAEMPALGQHAIEAAQHNERQHDALVLGWPKRPAQQISNLPDQIGEVRVAGHFTTASNLGLQGTVPFSLTSHLRSRLARAYRHCCPSRSVPASFSGLWRP